jgi:hypothetical protein
VAEVENYKQKLDEIKNSIDLDFWRSEFGTYDWERKKMEAILNYWGLV